MFDTTKMDAVSIVGGEYEGRDGYLHTEGECDALVYLADEDRLVSIDFHDLE